MSDTALETLESSHICGVLFTFELCILATGLIDRLMPFRSLPVFFFFFLFLI